MATDVLRPTARTITNPTVTNPGNAYNGNNGNFARFTESSNEQSAKMIVFTFPAGTVLPAERDSVSLTVVGEWASIDGNDKALVFFAPGLAAAFVLIDSKAPTNGWPATGGGPLARAFDITLPADTNPADGFRIGLEFYNGTGGKPDPDVPFEP